MVRVIFKLSDENLFLSYSVGLVKNVANFYLKYIFHWDNIPKIARAATVVEVVSVTDPVLIATKADNKLQFSGCELARMTRSFNGCGLRWFPLPSAK